MKSKPGFRRKSPHTYSIYPGNYSTMEMAICFKARSRCVCAGDCRIRAFSTPPCLIRHSGSCSSRRGRRTTLVVLSIIARVRCHSSKQWSNWEAWFALTCSVHQHWWRCKTSSRARMLRKNRITLSTSMVTESTIIASDLELSFLKILRTLIYLKDVDTFPSPRRSSGHFFETIVFSLYFSELFHPSH